MLETLIAILSLILGWCLKVLSDRMSERTTFDHRVRLEKEYGLYCDLWEKLFELRRAVGQLVNPLSSTSAVPHDKDFVGLFNAYQAAVYKGEPFMSKAIFDPAGEIVTITRKIGDNIGKHERLSGERLAYGSDSEAWVEERERLREENGAAFKEFERFFQAVGIAIRQRVAP